MNASNITFCINTSKNEINHIKLLFKSLEINLSRKDYDIIVFVDSDNQNTTDWLIDQKMVFKNLKIVKNSSSIPVGYQRNINLMFEMAKTDIVSYLQSDMVISKNYDLDIIKKLDENTVISSTRIEPPLHPQSPEKLTYDFGLDPTKFDFDSFQKISQQQKQNRLTDFWFAPFTLYKKIWNEIGGHDTLFRRSREDSDILYRLCIAGIKFKQDWNSIVYHFTCTSSRGKDWWKHENKEKTQLQSFADRIELMRFLKKWGKFKHDTQKNINDFKYNISINFKNTKNKENFILENYFLFNKISVDNKESYDSIKKEYEKQQDPANKLFDITDEIWQTTKSSYRTIDFEEIFNLSNVNDDVIINFDLNYLNETTFGYLQKIQDILKNSLNENDSGEFELENCIFVKVNKLINRLKDNIVVINPPFTLPLEYL
jgi:GT2 family glycosyltransferase